MIGRLAVGIACILLAASCAGDSTESELGPDPQRSIAQVLGEVCRRDAQGSGVLVAAELFLTSAHTVAGSTGGLSVRRPGADPLPATLVGFDPNRDLALLSVPGVAGDPAVLAPATTDTSGFIGTTDVDGQVEFLPYSVERLVTANSGDIYDEGDVVRSALQLNASTLPGDSGGALFDQSNHVVGIVFAQSRQTDNVAYAVAVTEVEAFLAETDTSTAVGAGRCP